MILGVVIAILLLVSFLFSGIEAGILSLNRVRLRNRAKHGDRAARRLQKLLRKPGRLLMTVVIVTNLANIFAITLATTALVSHWGRWGYGIGLVLFLPIYLFELFPKALFRRLPTHVLAALAMPLRAAYLALDPFFRIGSGITRCFSGFKDTSAQELFAAREDFKYVTLESERSGAITPAERRLIHGVVDFRLVTARDVMQPLSDFPTIRQDADVEELIAASRGGSLERFVVLSESGEILGIVPVFEAVLSGAPHAKVSAHLRKIASVPASETAFHLLRKLRTARTQAALVMEGGTPKGLVFAETLYRRLVSG